VLASRRDSDANNDCETLPPLGAIVARIDSAYEIGDYEQAIRLIEQDFIAAWFGMMPMRLAEIVQVLVRHNPPKGRFIETIHDSFFAGNLADTDGMLDSGKTLNDRVSQVAQRPANGGFPAVTAHALVNLLKLRMAGRPVEALRLAQEIEPHENLLQQAFGSVAGWGLFVTVQQGITAMYAGNFPLALQKFEQARTYFVPEPLAFLRRDATLKAALIEALYGDTERAKQLLEEAELVPHCGSWVEVELDSATKIVRALTGGLAADQALEMLETIPGNELGELWPVYLDALRRVLVDLGKPAEIAPRLAAYEQLQSVGSAGEGYTGSTIPLIRTLNAVLRGDVVEAREKLADADQSIVLTQVVSALVELASARPREALSKALSLRDQTRGLRLLNLWRLAATAGGHLALGSEEDCRETLEFALRQSGRVRPSDLMVFSAEVRSFAENKLPDWPKLEQPADGADILQGYRIFPDGGSTLTERELELLRSLAGDRTREEIAASMFISINTLKAHQRSLYRKLKVKSRAGAVLELERRGLH